MAKKPEDIKNKELYESLNPPLPPMTDEEARILQMRSDVIHADGTGLDPEISAAGRRVATSVIESGAPKREFDETTEAELYSLSQSVVVAMHELDMVYNPVSEKDAAAYQLHLGLLTIAGLGGFDTHEVGDYVRKSLEGMPADNADYSRRQSFRIADGLNMVAKAYDGAYDSGDEEESLERFNKFVYQFCPSKVWDNQEALDFFLDGVRDSYKILQIIFGKEHVGVASGLDSLRQEFLSKGAGLGKDPNTTEVNNMRVLAWGNWTEDN